MERWRGLEEGSSPAPNPPMPGSVLLGSVSCPRREMMLGVTLPTWWKAGTQTGKATLASWFSECLHGKVSFAGLLYESSWVIYRPHTVSPDRTQNINYPVQDHNYSMVFSLCLGVWETALPTIRHTTAPCTAMFLMWRQGLGNYLREPAGMLGGENN